MAALLEPARAPAAVQVFVDDSGSTSGVQSYWAEVHAVIRKLDGGGGGAPAEFFYWNTTLFPTTRDDVLANSKGRGSTCPYVCVPAMTASKVIVFTDGGIDHRDVQRCEQALASKYTGSKAPPEFTVYIFGRDIDLSVAAPFMRSGKSTIIYNGAAPLVFDVTAPAVDFDSITDPADYLARADDIYRTFLAANMGRGNPAARIAVLNMQKRLIDAAARLPPPSPPPTASDEDVRETVARLAREYYGGGVGVPKQIANYVAQLLLVCDSRGSYNAALLNTSAADRAHTAAVPDLQSLAADPADADATATAPGYQCPITMEGDTPVLILTSQDPESPGTAFLAGTSQRDMDELTACPIKVLKMPGLVERIKAALDPPVGLGACVAQGSRITVRSAFTRRPVAAALPLGDDDEHIRTANRGLHHWLTGGKVLGNPHLWFVALWAIARDVPFLADALPAMTVQLEHRLAKYTVPMGMSGLPDSPLTRVPLKVAFRYVLESSFLYERDPAKDRLRAFLGQEAELLIALAAGVVDSRGGGGDDDAAVADALPGRAQTYRKRVTELRTASHILHLLRDLPEQEGKARVRRLIRTCVQAHITIKDRLVLLDGPTDAGTTTAFAADRRLARLSPELCMTLADAVSTSVAFGATVIPVQLRPTPLHVVTNYSPQENAMQAAATRICPATLRPYSRIDGVPWEQLAEASYGPVQDQLSINFYALKYIIAKLAYPHDDVNDFVLYMYDRELGKEHRPRDTLPRNVVHSARLAAEELRRGLHLCATPLDAVAIIKAGFSRDARQAMEA